MKANASGSDRGEPGSRQQELAKQPTESWLFTAPNADALSFAQKSRLVKQFALVGVVSAVVFSVYFGLAVGSAAGTAVILIGGLVVASTPSIVRRTGSLRFSGHLLAAALMGVSCFITVLRGGLPVSSIFYLAPIPLIVRYLIGARAAWVWTSLCVAVVLGFCLRYMLGFPLESLIEADASELLALDFLGVIGLIALVHTLASAYDESKRRSAERQRQKVVDRLRQATRLESIGRLASGLAHDFNNLLTVILSRVTSIAQEDIDNPEVVEIFRDIETAALSAGDLTRQLLLFNREEEGESEILDIGSVVADTCALLARSMRDEVEVEIAVDQDLWSSRIDRGKLEQVLLNLMVNASDAMQGGGTLTIGAANVHLNDRLDAWREGVEPGRYVVLTVTDDGTGMPPEVRERLFDPFFTTKEKGYGTGLGLASVYGIVKKAGGVIWVESEVGKGSRFEVYLPAADGVPAPEVSTKNRPRGDETILIVENDDGVRAVARQILSRAGYRILEASSAVEALQVSASHQGELDLLLADLDMPVMSGPNLAERLLGRFRDLRVLFMSGLAGDALDRHGVSKADMSFVRKPLTDTSLRIEVRQTLDAGADESN